MIYFETTTNQEICMEITNKGKWIAYKDEHSYEINEIGDCYYVLPLIEFERELVIQKFEAEFSKNPNKSNITPSRLYKMLILFCLKSETHWGRKAISKVLLYDFNNELEVVVNKIIVNKLYHQNDRHLLMKLLAQFRK